VPQLADFELLTSRRMAVGRRNAAQKQTQPAKSSEAPPDLTKLFENAGNDVAAIALSDADRQIQELIDQIQPQVSWDDQISAMQVLMGLVRGGALSNVNFRRQVPSLASGLSSAVTNMRSALVKQSCLVLAQLARELGVHFDQFGDIIAYLSTQLSHGTQIISESCKFAILNIVKSCQSRRVLLGVINLAGKKGAAPHCVAAQSFSVIFGSWQLDPFASTWPRVETVIMRLLSDPSPAVRQCAKDALKCLQVTDTPKYERIIATVDPRLRREFCPPRAKSPPQNKPHKPPRRDRKQPAASQSRSPKKQEIVESSFSLIEGQERAFLSSIRGAIDEGEVAKFEGCVIDVILGVLRCCVHESPQISVPGFQILHDIVPPFRFDFQPVLAKLIHLLLRAIESSHKISSSAESILNELDQSFDSNELARIAISEPPSPALVRFIGRLLASPEVRLTDDSLCLSVLRITASFQSTNHIPLLHTIGHILVQIDSVNHSVIVRFCNSLPPAEKDHYEEFVHPYLPHFRSAIPDTSIPQFDPQQAISFRRRVVELSRTTSEAEWTQIRSALYDELNKSLCQETIEKGALLLITALFEEKTFTDYHKLLPGLLVQSKGPWHQLVDNIVVSLLSEVGLRQVLAAIAHEIEIGRPATCQAAIELVTRIIATVDGREIVAAAGGLFRTLTDKLIQNEVPEVRKAAVLCFVEMKVVGGTEVDAIIDQLGRPQQKLIAVYYSRRVA
jgi:hypothetical protein